jgi:hypothetical protein
MLQRVVEKRSGYRFPWGTVSDVTGAQHHIYAILRQVKNAACPSGVGATAGFSALAPVTPKRSEGGSGGGGWPRPLVHFTPSIHNREQQWGLPLHILLRNLRGEVLESLKKSGGTTADYTNITDTETKIFLDKLLLNSKRGRWHRVLRSGERALAIATSPRPASCACGSNSKESAFQCAGEARSPRPALSGIPSVTSA